MERTGRMTMITFMDKGRHKWDLGQIKMDPNYRKCFNLQQLLNLTSFLLL